jgi:hypothetical protein
MSSLLFQGGFATGLDESEAQSTIEPIRTDPSEAEEASPPEWNATSSDDSGQLIGLSPRPVGSFTEAPVKAPPVGLVMGTYDRAKDGNDGIDRQVASSGTAAARESAGQFGHGTIQTEIGIEPLNPAQEYGNDYFSVPDPGANYAGGAYMTPPETDNWTQAVAQSRAQVNARQAFRSTQYGEYFGGGM